MNSMMDSSVGKVYVVNYNFRYVLVDPSMVPETKLGDNIRIYPVDGNTECFFDCEYVRSLREKTKLYFIRNHAEVSFNEEVIALIDKWENYEEII